MNVGNFRGSRHDRYWVGGCTCGSGKEGREWHDKHGIYAGITCTDCKKKERYEQLVRDDPGHDLGEPVEEG